MGGRWTCMCMCWRQLLLLLLLMSPLPCNMTLESEVLPNYCNGRAKVLQNVTIQHLQRCLWQRSL